MSILKIFIKMAAKDVIDEEVCIKVFRVSPYLKFIVIP